MNHSIFRSDRAWWIAGGLIAVAVVVLLAAISRQGPQEAARGSLLPGESELLPARVVEILEEGTVDQGEFQQPD